MYRWNVSIKGCLLMSADSLFLYFLHAFCQTKKNKITANVNPILDKKYNQPYSWESWCTTMLTTSPANIYLFKVNNRNIRKKYETCPKLTSFWWPRSGVFIVNFEHISYLFPVFLLLTLNKLDFFYKQLRISSRTRIS